MPNDKPQKPYLYRDNYKNNSFPARAARAVLRTADTGIYDLLHFFPNVIAKSYNYVTGRPDISVFQSVNDDNYYKALDAMKTLPKPPATSSEVVTPQTKYQSKPKTVSEVFRDVTGLPWSEAKKLGLTDGSYTQNIQLLRDLKSGKITKSSIDSMREALIQSASIPESERIVIIPERIGRELSFEDVPRIYDASMGNAEEQYGFNPFEPMSDRDFRRNERFLEREDRRNAQRAAKQQRQDTKQAIENNRDVYDYQLVDPFEQYT